MALPAKPTTQEGQAPSETSPNPSPIQAELDKEGLALLEAAVAADRAVLLGDDPGPASPTSAEGDKPAEADKSVTPAKQEAKPEQAAPTKSKAEKGQERLERTWKQVNEQKQALQAERDAIEQARKDLEAQRSQLGHAVKTEEDKQADQFEELARSYKADGNDQMAQAAIRKAEELRTAGRTKLAQAEQARFKQVWEANFWKVADEHQDLHDPESDLYKQVDALIRQEPILRAIPDGAAKAVNLVKQASLAARVPDLEAKLAASKTEIDNLTKKLALTGSLPQDTLPEGKRFEDMTLDQMGVFLKSKAEQYDRDQLR